MRILATILVATTAITAVVSQYQQPQSGNYRQQDEYADFDQQPRPAHPTPRSYATGSPASERQQAASPKPTPVAILKQINRHNEDGSYTYGFEGGDGSFKIETKLANGEVKGKYGFVDDTGKVRVVEYGANKYGFQPSGEGITVAPPTLFDDTENTKEGEQNQSYQDYDYQQQQQQQQQQQHQSAVRPAAAPQRAIAQPIAAPPRNHYQPQYEQPSPQSHTQAIYNPQLPRGRAPNVPKVPSFAPAQAPQSQLLRANYEEPAPASQAYNQGPVQFSPAPTQERSQPQPRSQPNGGILDQLARDYALPQGGSPPLHDISFGFY